MISVNDHEKLSFEEFTQLVKKYWRKSDKPKSIDVKANNSIVENKYGKVTGCHKISNGPITAATKTYNWTVEFNFRTKEKWWVINKIQIEGIEIVTNKSLKTLANRPLFN